MILFKDGSGCGSYDLGSCVGVLKVWYGLIEVTITDSDNVFQYGEKY